MSRYTAAVAVLGLVFAATSHSQPTTVTVTGQPTSRRGQARGLQAYVYFYSHGSCTNDLPTLQRRVRLDQCTTNSAMGTSMVVQLRTPTGQLPFYDVFYFKHGMDCADSVDNHTIHLIGTPGVCTELGSTHGLDLALAVTAYPAKTALLSIASDIDDGSDDYAGVACITASFDQAACYPAGRNPISSGSVGDTSATYFAISKCADGEATVRLYSDPSCNSRLPGDAQPIPLGCNSTSNATDPDFPGDAGDYNDQPWSRIHATVFGLVHRHGHVGGSSYRVVPRKIPPKNRPLSCINFGRSEDQTIMVFQLFQGGQGGGQESDTCEPLAAACSTGFYPTLHPEELVPYKTLKWLSSWYLVFGMTGSMVLAVVLFVIFLRFKMMTVVSDTATDFYHRRERFSGLRPEIFPTRLHVISPITDVWSTIKPPNEVAESDRDGAKPSVKVKECYEPRRYNHCSPEDCDRAWLVTEVCRLQKNATASKTNGNAHGCPMILDISHQKTWPDTTCDRFMACLDELTKHIGHVNKATGGEINRSLLKRLYVGSLRPDTIKYYLIDDLMEQIHDAEVVGGVQIDLRFCDIQDRLLAPQRNVLEEVLSLKYSDAMAELTGEEASRVNVKVHIIHESSSTNTDFFELNAKVQMYSKDFARRFEPPTDAATSETVMALLATLAIGWLCCVVSAMGGFGSNGEGPANAVAFWVTIIGVVGLAIYAVYRIPSSCYGREVPAKDATGTPKKKIWTRFGLTMLTVGLTGAWVACAIIAGLYIAEGDTNAGHGLMIVSIVLAVVWIAWLDISTWLFWTKSYPPDDDNKNQPDDDNKNQLNKVKEKKNSKLIEWQTGPDSRLRVTFEGVPTRIQQGQDNKKWHAAWLGRSVTSREQDVLKAFFRQRLENFIFVNGTKLKSKRGEAGLATLGRRRDSSVFKTTSEPGQTSSDWCRIDVHCFPNTVPRASCKLWFWWPPILVYGMGWESNHTEEVESDFEVREAITVDISLFRDYRSKDEVKEDGHIRKGFMKDFYRYLLASCEDSSDTAFGHHKHSFYMCHLLTDLADDVKTPDPIQYWKILLPVLTFVLADLVLTGAAGSDAVVESSLTWAAVVMLVLWGGMLLRSIGNDRKKEVQIITDAGAKPVTVDSLQSKLNAHSYEGDGWYVYSVLMTVFPIITITCIVLAVQDIGGDTVLVSTAIVFFAASVLTGLLRHCRHPRNKRDLWVKYGPRWLRMDGPILLFPLIILACVVLIVQDVGEAKTADRLTIAAVVFGLALGVAFVIRVYWHNSLFGETDESQSFQGYYNDPASQVGEWTRFNMYLLAFGAGEFFFALTTVLTVWWQTSIIDCIVLRHTSRDALCYDPTLEGYQCYNDFNMTASKDDTFQTDTEGDGFLGIIAAHYAHAMKDSADFISCEATDNFTAATCFLKYDFTFAAYLDNAGSAQGLFVFLTSSIAFLVAKMVFLFSKQYTIMRDTIVATTISTSALAAVGVWLIYSMQMRYSIYSVMLGIEIFGFVTFLMSRIAMLIWIQNLEDKLFRFGRPEYNGEDDDATQMRKAGLESADPTLKIFDNLGNTAQINSATEVDWLQSQTVRPLGANLHSSIDLEFHWNLDALGATFTDGQVPRRKLGIPVHITLVGTRRSTAELHFMLNMGIGATFATIQISTKFLGRIIRVEVKFVNLLEGKPVAGFNPCWLDGDCTSFPEIKDEGPKMSDLTKELVVKHEEYFVEEQENGAFISRPTERKDGETRKDGEVMFRKGDATRHTNVKFKSDDVATNKKKDVTVFLRENYDKWDKDWLRTFNSCDHDLSDLSPGSPQIVRNPTFRANLTFSTTESADGATTAYDI